MKQEGKITERTDSKTIQYIHVCTGVRSKFSFFWAIGGDICKSKGSKFLGHSSRKRQKLH